MIKEALFLIGMTLFIFPVQVVFAQETTELPALSGDLIEEYSADVNVSGVLVSGMWIGELDTIIDPGSVFALIPSGLVEKSLCFTSSTRDGVYFAKSKLIGASGRGGFHTVEPMKSSGYRSVLSNYRGRDFAIRILASTACDTGLAGTLVPAALDIGSSNLVVAINSRRAIRTEAWITENGVRHHGNCTRETKTRSTAFDTICAFDFEKLKGVGSALLTIRRTPRAGPTRIEDMAVHL